MCEKEKVKAKLQNTAKTCRTTVCRLNYRLLLCLTMPGLIIHEYFLISLCQMGSDFCFGLYDGQSSKTPS